MPALGRRCLAALTLASLVVISCAPGGTPTVPRAATTSPAQTRSGGSPPAASASSASPTTSVAPSQPFDPNAVSIELEVVAAGLDSPLAVTHAGDGSGRLFVAEQGGAIRIVRDGMLTNRPFLDITGRIRSGGERGLLGLVFHPEYPDDPRFFVNYTDKEGDTQIAAYRHDPADPDRAIAEETRLLSIGQPYANHNGGALAFGPDGYLYIATGDGGSGGDPHGFGQALDAVLGKILRIDVDAPTGSRQYSVPDDNPFVATPGARPEIWHYGLRNPWRISFDRANGDLWIGDVGQNAWEEVDVARGGTGGLNFGWNRMEGAHCFRPESGCEDPALTLPVTEYAHDEGGCTILGGNVYRGAAQSALAGGYLFADYCSGLMWAINAGTDGPVAPVLVAETGRSPSAFGEDEAGEIYVTDISAGELLRVVAAAR